MAKVLFPDEQASNIVYTVIMEHPPYNGDVEFDLLPKTRERTVECGGRAKRNPIYNAHTKIVEGRRKSFPGNPGEALVQELAKDLVVNWRGVVDAAGNEVPCTEENKVTMFNNVDVANWIIKKAGEVGVIETELDEGNSES